MGTIRAATLNDIPAVKDCAKAAYEPYVERIGREPAPMQANFIIQLNTHKFSVIEHDNSVVGFIVYQPMSSGMLLENVAVHPHFTGNGFGKLLIKHVEQAAVQMQLPKIVLYTNVAMIENLTLYPNLGYTETERIEEDGFERVYFHKYLK